MPHRMQELWPWVSALDAWDYCDSRPLSVLVKKEPIPDELRGALSDIIAGRRKANKKGAAKLKIPAAERMKIAGTLSVVMGLADVFTMKGVEPSLDENADRQGVEPIEIIKQLNEEKRRIVQDTASDYDVSVETIENLLRDLREKINKWPSV